MRRRKDKVLIIPFTYTKKNRLRFLTVKDRYYKEWTFISGTIEKNELPDEAAVRELFEETKKTVHIQLTPFNHTTFTLVEFNYTVYFIDITNYKSEKEIMTTFANTHTRGVYNENSFLSFDELNFFKSKNLWSFISDYILPHPSFLSFIKQFQ